jgi:hypothetical protein
MEVEEKSRKSSTSFGWSTIIFTCASIVLVIILNAIDKGPPLPPFGEHFTSVDCHAVEFSGFQDRAGFLDFNFRVQASVEYPPEYLAHFLSIKVETGPTTMSYSGDHITNITRDSNHIEFSIIHPWAGPSSFTAQCLHNPPQTLTGRLTDIVNFVPEHSRSDNPGIDHAKFKDVCLEYEKFLFFVQVVGERPAVPFDGETLRFEMLKWPLEAYLKHKKVTMTHKICYLVAPLEKVTWKMILLTMIPLAVSVDRNSPKDSRPLFIFRKQIPEQATENLRLLSVDPPVKLADIMCFDTLLMTSTYSKFTNTEDRIGNAVKLDVAPLRNHLPKVPTDKNTIVLCENLWDVLESRIREKFSDAQLVRLGAQDTMQEAIRKVQPASVFIGDHLSNLVHMLWLNSQSIVLDLTPAEFECTGWGQTLANNATLKYVALFTGNCKCREFSCYPKAPIPLSSDNFDAILEQIRRARMGSI